MYRCPICRELWDVNACNGLIPSRYPAGAWYLDEGKKDNCPGCCEEEKDTTGSWIWAEPSDGYYKNIVTEIEK